MKEISTDDLNIIRKVGQSPALAFHRLFEIFAVFLGKAPQYKPHGKRWFTNWSQCLSSPPRFCI
jgi:hypothetical protein